MVSIQRLSGAVSQDGVERSTAFAHDHWRGDGEVDDCGGHDAAIAPVEHCIDLVLETRLDLAAGSQWLRRLIVAGGSVGQDERRAHERLAELTQQQLRHGVIRNAHADGAPLLVLQAPRRLAGGSQEKGIGPGQAGLQQPELPGVEVREPADLGEIGADQGEMVVAVRPAQAADALQGILVADVPPERVAGIGGIGNDAALAQDVRRLADEARLGRDGMKVEVVTY